MHSGIMYHITEPKDLTQRIAATLAMYHEKTGGASKLVIVNDEQYKPVNIEGVTVKPEIYIRPNNFFVVIGETGGAA